MDNLLIQKSKEDTLAHIARVGTLIYNVLSDLVKRSCSHDRTKLESPELEVFAVYGPKLKDSTYMAEDYNRFRVEMKKALDHHYACNRHHPEHFADGIRGMNLVDLIEMICDWKAASERHANGDVYESIEKNQERFGYSDELKQIFINTVRSLEELDNGGR